MPAKSPSKREMVSRRIMLHADLSPADISRQMVAEKKRTSLWDLKDNYGERNARQRFKINLSEMRKIA